MTTVVYYNGVIAADAQTTRIRPAGDFVCSECNSPDTLHVGKSEGRIYLGNFSSFRDERVLACAFAGSLEAGKHLMKSLQTGHDMDEMLLMSAALHARPVTINVSVMLVTDKSVYRADLREHRPIFERTGLDVPVGIGTGSSEAVAVCKMFGVSATDAIRFSALSDAYSGIGIYHLDLTQPKSEFKVQYEELPSGQELKSEFKARIAAQLVAEGLVLFKQSQGQKQRRK